MQLDIVTPDRKVIVQETSDVIIPGSEGELEVLPGHAPLLTILGTGILSFKHQGAQTRLVVSGGFVEIDRDRIVVMAESASLVAEVVREEANQEQYAAEQKLKELGPVSVESEDFQMLQAEVDRAAAKLTLIR
jgi:F-type H+-transporting ATPase subunit epsilon